MATYEDKITRLQVQLSEAKNQHQRENDLIRHASNEYKDKLEQQSQQFQEYRAEQEQTIQKMQGIIEDRVKSKYEEIV